MARKGDIVIFNARIAKQLLNKGYPIKNIAPNKQNKDKTVFFFERTKEIEHTCKTNGIHI